MSSVKNTVILRLVIYALVVVGLFLYMQYTCTGFYYEKEGDYILPFETEAIESGKVCVGPKGFMRRIREEYTSL